MPQESVLKPIVNKWPYLKKLPIASSFFFFFLLKATKNVYTVED